MLEDYLQSAASQLIERASGLKGKLPRPPLREFERLATQCCDGINRAIQELTTLRDNAAWKKPENASVRLLEFRRIASNVDRLENEAVAPIVRSSKDEGAMVKLLYRMSSEIVYPIELPTVSMLSQNYFFIRTDFKLMCIPLMETQFLLHLPDVYHELSHPLFRTQHDPRTKPWLDAFLLAKALIYDHLRKQIAVPEKLAYPRCHKTLSSPSHGELDLPLDGGDFLRLVRVVLRWPRVRLGASASPCRKRQDRFSASASPVQPPCGCRPHDGIAGWPPADRRKASRRGDRGPLAEPIGCRRTD